MTELIWLRRPGGIPHCYRRSSQSSLCGSGTFTSDSSFGRWPRDDENCQICLRMSNKELQ